MRNEPATSKPRIGLTFAIVVSIVAGALPFAGAASVEAQELIRRRPWSLFDIFRPALPRRDRGFDDRSYRDAPRANRPSKSRKAAAAKAARKAQARLNAASTPEIAAVEKAPDAKVILVVGDFLASGLAEGLTAQFEQVAGYRIADRSKGSSGFVREDVVDWDKELPAILAAEKPVAVIVMMGSNDRQSMRIGDTTEPAGSDAWVKEYGVRVGALADVLEASKVPYLWVGMPAFKSPKMTSDMLAFNDIYKASAQANKGEFIDIWDGFVDENGAFVSTGPDVNGQPAKLRGGDGINLSKAGKAKVAFYTDKPLRKLLGIDALGPLAPLAPAAGVSPNVPPALDRTAPMSLNDPEIDGGNELLGAQPASAAPAMPAAPAKSPISIAPGSAPGRADDFSWARREAERLPATTVETTTAIKR